MKIILLSGKANSGKTSTCNDLYSFLTINGGTEFQVKKMVGGNPKDFECILDYCQKKIAIYSMGDYYRSCIEAIVKYSDSDILVLAYSDKFSNDLGAVVNRCKPNVLIQKTPNNEQDVKTIVANI